MPVLVVVKGPVPGHKYPLGASNVIGRGSTPDVSISDPALSRRHCLISGSDENYNLEDLNSTNGVKLNGRTLRETTLLCDGDEIGIGRLLMVFYIANDRSSEGEQKASDPWLDAGETMLEQGSINKTASRFRSVSRPVSPLSPFPDVCAKLAEVLLRRDAEPGIAEVFVSFCEASSVFERALLIEYDNRRDALSVMVSALQSSNLGERIDHKLLTFVLESRQEIFCADVVSDQRSPVAHVNALLGVQSVAIMPLIHDNQVLGVLYLDGCKASSKLVQDEVRWLRVLGQQCLLWLVRKAAFESGIHHVHDEKDIASARAFQEQITPSSPPELDGYGLKDSFLAADSLSHSMVTYQKTDDGDLVLLMAQSHDGSLTTGMALSFLAAQMQFLPSETGDIQQVMSFVVDRASSAMDGKIDLSLLALVLKSDTGEITSLDVNHEVPVLLKADGNVLHIASSGAKSIWNADNATRAVHAKIEHGDSLVVYSEGIVELPDHRGRRFGLNGVDEALASSHTRAGTPLNALVRKLREHAGGASAKLDQNLVCITRNAPDSQK